MQLAEVVKDASGVGSGIFGKELGAGGLLRPGLVLKTGLEESGLHGPEKNRKGFIKHRDAIGLLLSRNSRSYGNTTTCKRPQLTYIRTTTKEDQYILL